MKTLKKIFALLTPHEQKRAGLLMVMVLVMSLLDIMGVASILPFMAVLANPDIVHDNPFLRAAFTASRYVGIRTSEHFLFVLSLIVFILLIVSLAFKAITNFILTRFALMREYSIGKRLVEGYLHQPYSWFLDQHSADLGKSILSEVQTVVNNGILPLMTLMTQCTTALMVLILLIIVDPFLALSVGLVLSLVYSCILMFMSDWLKRLGRARVHANQKRFTAVNEAFGAAKVVKVGGLENFYIQRFAEPAETFAKGQATARVIAQMPRFALEAIAFGGMLLVILYLMAKSGSFVATMPIISLYAFAAYRLMPALQQIYQAVTQLRFVGPGLNALHKDLSSLEIAYSDVGNETPMSVKQAITLNRVSYRYPSAPGLALNCVDISIPAHSVIGLVGATGSGKTTAVDVILGLLEPVSGSLCVDGIPITTFNRRRWQRAIGYVPQDIYLSDASVAANIAFGAGVINQQAVEHAAKIANLHEFAVNELPEGYATTVGERGVRLSGGQRQRIGIARALYQKPQILILDEATSALDNLTEKAVMEALTNLGHDITVVMIAHRLSTVRKCDRIYFLEHGEVMESGSYHELISSSRKFMAMANEEERNILKTRKKS